MISQSICKDKDGQTPWKTASFFEASILAHIADRAPPTQSTAEFGEFQRETGDKYLVSGCVRSANIRSSHL